MRRSHAPSAECPRLGVATNITARPPDVVQTEEAGDEVLHHSNNVASATSWSGVSGPQQSSSCPADSGKLTRPYLPPVSKLCAERQYKCPVPGASGSSGRGTLGLKKNYANITGDILKGIQHTVYLNNETDTACASSDASELVLYDPGEHRLLLRQMQPGQSTASVQRDPNAASTEVDAAAAAKPTVAAELLKVADAGHISAQILDSTAASIDTAAASPTVAGGSCYPQADSMQGDRDFTQSLQQQQVNSLLPCEAAVPLHDACTQSQQQHSLGKETPAPQCLQGDWEFGINWSKRVKVYADMFLVEKLRPHQREGLKFVFECLTGIRQEGVCGAVLADGMGLGKTFQTVASLYSLLTKGVAGKPTCTKPLILCPTSLVQNWGKELRHWLGERLTPVVVDDTRASCVKKCFQDFHAYSPPGNPPKVLVMSYPCFRMHKTEVYNMGIDVVMCDEAHFLKNGEAKITQAVAGLSARRRLLMSGTPIQNDLSEFHAVFDLACPGLLGNIKAFNRRYEGPIQRGRDADATKDQVSLGFERMAELMKLCNKFMLRRTSTVLKSLLPTKVEQVVFCKLSPLQLKLYNAFLNSKPVQALLATPTADDDETGTTARGSHKKRRSTKAAAAGGGLIAACCAADKENIAPGATAHASDTNQGPVTQQKCAALAPLVAITALKKLCCHPDLIWDMLNKHRQHDKQRQQQQQQLVELMAAQQRVSGRAAAVVDYASLHGQSDDDVDNAYKAGKRPEAKKRKSGGSSKASSGGCLTGFEGTEPLFTDNVYPPYQPGKCQAYHSGKVMVLEALLKAIKASEPTDKVVMVSNYTEALDILGGMCATQHWVSLRLDGSCSVKQRQAIVDTFNDPQHPSFILLLSSKAGGVGLNIIGANRLVLFDPDWNPANDLQAMARVWREGQKKRVWIYRMLMAGSIEEKVLQRQLAKQGLSEALVDQVGQQVRTFSRDELRSLFKVNPSVTCETHTAIKCSCDGSLEAMESCKQRAAAAAVASSSSGGESDQQGVMAWAHLAKAADSPDPTWRAMTSFVRDNYVTYVFSDHVLDQAASAGIVDPESTCVQQQQQQQQSSS